MPTFLEVSISPTPVSQEEADHTALILPSRLSPNGPYNVDGAKSRMDRAILDDGRSRSSEKSIYWRNMEDIRWTELWPFKSQFPWLDPHNNTYPEYMLMDELRLEGVRSMSGFRRESSEPKPLSPSPNDWIVTDEEVHENEVIILTGNLIIQAGGNLTLINCTLLMKGEWQIRVKSNGIMNVLEGSNITAYDPKYKFLFYVYGRLMVRDSFLSRCERLHLETTEGVELYNTTIKNCNYGIYCYDSSGISIISCTIKNNSATGLLCKGSSNITISGCTISNCTGASRWRTHAGVYIRASVNVTVKNNIFYRNGIILEGKEISHLISHIIENNTVNGKPLCYVINTTDI